MFCIIQQLWEKLTKWNLFIFRFISRFKMLLFRHWLYFSFNLLHYSWYHFTCTYLRMLFRWWSSAVAVLPEITGQSVCNVQCISSTLNWGFKPKNWRCYCIPCSDLEPPPIVWVRLDSGTASWVASRTHCRISASLSRPRSSTEVLSSPPSLYVVHYIIIFFCPPAQSRGREN